MSETRSDEKMVVLRDGGVALELPPPLVPRVLNPEVVRKRGVEVHAPGLERPERQRALQLDRASDVPRRLT